MKQPYEIGPERPGLNWLELTYFEGRALEGRVLLRVGDRGYAHDEPPTYQDVNLTLGMAAELRDYLARVVPADVEPTASRQYEPRPCDDCGELVDAELDRYAWCGPPTRIGWRRRTSWFGHIRCKPTSLATGW